MAYQPQMTPSQYPGERSFRVTESYQKENQRPSQVSTTGPSLAKAEQMHYPRYGETRPELGGLTSRPQITGRPSSQESITAPIPLDFLVTHLLHAKRHLSCIAQLYRAKHIVHLARQSLQDSVVINARTASLRQGLNEELSLLYAVKAKLDSENQRRRNEFDATLTELSSVEDLVKEAIDELGSVAVEKGFLATRNSREGEDEQERTLVLRDFIEESNVEALRADIQHAIDSVTTAQRTLASSTEAFDTELKNVRKQLARHRRVVVNASGSVSLSCTSSSSSASSKHLRQTNANTSGPSLKVITELLHSLETKAEYLADLLQSLVRHYDLCVSAVRHTDGGWAAAKSIVGDLSTSSTNDKPSQDHEGGTKITRNSETCEGNPPDELEPLSTSEYHQMLNVINADAPLAEDVTVEIHEHLAEMENTLAHVLQARDAFASVYASTLDVLHCIEGLIADDKSGARAYVRQSSSFGETWEAEKASLADGLRSLIDLREMYKSFSSAYDKCILEAARRRSVWRDVEKVLGNARGELEKIYAADEVERQRVKEEVGMFLPVGVWDGMCAAMAKVDFVRRPEEALPENEDNMEQEKHGGVVDTATRPTAEDELGTVRTPNRERSGRGILSAPDSANESSIPSLPDEAINQARRRMAARLNEEKEYHRLNSQT